VAALAGLEAVRKQGDAAELVSEKDHHLTAHCGAPAPAVGIARALEVARIAERRRRLRLITEGYRASERAVHSFGEWR
jgi:hypothetical protein